MAARASPAETTLRVIGSGSLFPGPDGDAPCCLVNDRLMVDTGYWAAHRLLRWDLHAGLVDHLLITHYHPYHTIGLPLVFCYRRGLPFIGREVRRMAVLGPAESIETLMRRTRDFLEIPEEEDLAEVVPMEPGGVYESEPFRIWAYRANHPVPGLVYRVRDNETAAEIGLAWDTAYDPDMAAFFRDVDLLVHDAAHSRPREAALCAREAGARRLALIHGDRPEVAVAEAREVFPEAAWPEDGEVIRMGS